MEWYPHNKEELKETIKEYLKESLDEDSEIDKEVKGTIRGVISPHAGYQFSGPIAGKAFSLLRNENEKPKRAIILGPSHYEAFSGFKIMQNTQSPLGEINFPEDEKTNKLITEYQSLEYEHSVDNQIPFLQYLNPEIEILPLVVGRLNNEKVSEISEKITNLLDEETVLVISTDLSHFLPYQEAIKRDRETIEAIKELDSEKLMSIENSSCGIFPLLVLLEICKKKEWEPKLVDYKTTGDIAPEALGGGVVGYAGMVF